MGIYSGTIWISLCQETCDVNVTPTDIPLSVPLECMSVVHFKRFELIRRLSAVPFQHFAGSR